MDEPTAEELVMQTPASRLRGIVPGLIYVDDFAFIAPTEPDPKVKSFFDEMRTNHNDD